jgi:hypothetical protein
MDAHTTPGEGPVRDDRRQRLLSGGCGEQLSWAEPASSYPEQIGAFTHGFRLRQL